MLFSNNKNKKINSCIYDNNYQYCCCDNKCYNYCDYDNCEHECNAEMPCCEICPTSATGVTGPNGATGTNGLSEYAYIYNLDAQVVAIESDISFSSNGVIVGTINHMPGTSTIQIGSAGDYAILFYANGVEPNQFTLFQNSAPVAGSVYGSGTGTQGNTGMVIVTAATGDILTVRNHSSASAVTLQTLAGGTQINSNATILIPKIS